MARSGLGLWARLRALTAPGRHPFPSLGEEKKTKNKKKREKKEQKKRMGFHALLGLGPIEVDKAAVQNDLPLVIGQVPQA